MKAWHLPLFIVPLTLLLSGCVTAATLNAAKDDVTYKPKCVDGVVIGSEVDKVEKGNPLYYPLVPFAAVADVALLPAYVAFTIAVNLGIVPPP